MAAQHLAATII